MHDYDKSSKWLIQHHGDSILRLAGVNDIASWTPLQAELVQSRRLPDGVLEVRSRGEAEPDVFILEIATYPDTRVPSQAVRDTALVYLDRDIVPEVIVLFLHPNGNVEAADSAALRSRRGLTKWDLSWKAVKLWEVAAEELLAAGDVGLIPWVPLADFEGPPEQVVRRCRDRIDRDARPGEHENLLAVTQFLLGLRYNDLTLRERLAALLGGRQAMIESPILQEIIADNTRKTATETRQKDILNVLVARFGDMAETLEDELKAVDVNRLDALVKLAAKCRSLASFRKQLSS
ncbi:MAG: hypothetical protein ACHRXM_26660 [Isosphaerales bacterium]